MQPMTKLPCLLDSGPVISLSAFKIPVGRREVPIIDVCLPYMDIWVASTVANEATRNAEYPDAHLIAALIAAKKIRSLPVPATLPILDTYSKLHAGERDIIRVAQQHPTLVPVLDDIRAFVVASRCELSPLLLLDVIIRLVREHGLPKREAHSMVDAWADKVRYAAGFTDHTHVKLDEV